MRLFFQPRMSNQFLPFLLVNETGQNYFTTFQRNHMFRIGTHRKGSPSRTFISNPITHFLYPTIPKRVSSRYFNPALIKRGHAWTRKTGVSTTPLPSKNEATVVVSPSSI